MPRLLSTICCSTEGTHPVQIPELTRNTPDRDRFNGALRLPYELRVRDFESAMQDRYGLAKLRESWLYRQ